MTKYCIAVIDEFDGTNRICYRAQNPDGLRLYYTFNILDPNVQWFFSPAVAQKYIASYAYNMCVVKFTF